jgi:beta-N-acetylhexosaminidase
VSARREAEDLAASVLVVGAAGTHLRGDEAARIARLGPAGIILFARNVEAEDQLRELIRRSHDVLRAPLVLIDQEGGRVDRLRALRGPRPSARALAQRGVEAVEEEARLTACLLRDLGVTFNCAPVVDLDEGREGNGIGDRSFGADPEVVATLAQAVLRAHAQQGIATCLKHFPGLGRTGEDTHLTRPAVTASLPELRERELIPFRLLLDEAPAVMVSHAAFPRVTGGDEPASSSRAILQDLLRRELAYDGLIVSDDMEMGAVTARPPGERAVAALTAGCDLLLFCSDLDQAEAAHSALVEAALRDRLGIGRLRDAASRVRALARRLDVA